MKKFLLFFFFITTLFFVLPQSTYAFGECTTAIDNNLYPGQCGICGVFDTVNGGKGSCWAGNCCVKESVIRQSQNRPTPTPTPFTQSLPRCVSYEGTTSVDPCPSWYGGNSYCAGADGDYLDGCMEPTTPINTPRCVSYEETTTIDPCADWHGENSYCGGVGGDFLDGCTESRSTAPSPKPTTKPRSNPPSGGGGGGGGGSQPAPIQSSCPADGDSCFYNEGDKCYSGHGASGVNQEGCVYSCGPVNNDNCKISSKEEKKSKNKKVIECTPGEPVNDCSTKCKNGGTCKEAHTFCEWTEDGNVESKCVCNDEDSSCSSGEEKGSGGGSCKDNPTSPPDGYTWKNSCKSCGSNDNCPKNTSDGAVNPDTSNWCFGGSCLMLTSGGSSEKKSDSSSKKTSQKEKDKKKKQKAKDVNDGITKDDTGNRTKQNNEKSARDKAQKPIDKINKDRIKQGLPTLTPLPPDWDPKTANNPTPTVVPTPLPPLPEPTNWQGFCGQTTDPNRPWGIRVSWDPVVGAQRYAVRIDEDAPSWEGDTPSVGDTVDNQVKDTVYARVAKPGAVYQWWVHSVNASGVYSGLTKKMIIKCPQENPPAGSGTPIPKAVGAGQLIVLPQATTTVPTATPTPKK